jgi:DNA replication protein DnaC
LGKLIDDAPATTAILDRFLHNAEVITISGKSYRLRNRSPKEQPPATATACREHPK